MNNPYQIIKHLHITEKTQRLVGQFPNKCVFTVPAHASKLEIKRAVQEIYPTVKVTKVNTALRPTKTKRMGKSRPGQTATMKTAYVTLRHGDRIE